MNIPLSACVQGFGIAMTGTFVVILLMSIVSMFIVGRRKYFEQLRYLWKFRIDKTFVKTFKFGTNHVNINLNEDYYFFVNVIDDKEVVVVKCLAPYFTFWNIQSIRKINGEWVDDDIKVTMSSCLFSHLLKVSISKKMKKEVSNSIRIDNTNIINDFLNTELIQLSRDKKLKEILK